MQKATIQVRVYEPGQTRLGSERLGAIDGDYGHHQVKETIKRTLRAEAIGNFCPLFCAYNGRDYLVHSELGDLSDPFRAEESYLTSLFIEEENPANKP